MTKQKKPPKGLGRRHSYDLRDGKFMLKPPREAADVTYRYWGSFTPILDQGETSECVVYSCDKFLTSSPIVNKTFGTNADRHKVYKEVQKMDEWPGENYDGTSVRAMMKWLQEKQLITGYRWAFDWETAINHILTTGPLCLGTNWYYGMFDTDKDGYVHPTGQNAGGHAYIAIGANRNKKNPDGSLGAVQCINSWGASWGQKGRFWMTFKDLEKLISEDGEAATPTEVKKIA